MDTKEKIKSLEYILEKCIIVEMGNVIDCELIDKILRLQEEIRKLKGELDEK